MSIVRVGLAETPGYAEGYEAIFGKKEPKKKDETPKTETATATPTTKPEEQTPPAKKE